MFYLFDQNNSGGDFHHDSFNGIGYRVIIEADSAGELVERKHLTADEMEAAGCAPWQGKQPIEEFVRYRAGKPWVPLYAAIAQLQFWQRRDYEHAIAAMAAVGTWEEGYTAGELKWAEAMDKQIGIEESLRTQLAASQADVARLREVLGMIEAIGDGSKTANSLTNIADIARAAIKDTQP